MFYEPGMIVAFMGSLGAGKTLHMTVQAYYAWLMHKIPLYTNYETYYDMYSRVAGMRGLVTRENGLLCIDEMQAILDSRAFAKNVDITQWLVLIRKVGLGLFYTTQHIDFVDLRLRNITDYIFVHQKAWHYGKKSSLVEVYRMNGSVASYITQFVLTHEQWMYSLYNSYDRKVKLTLDGYTLPFAPEWLDVTDSVNGSSDISSPLLAPPEPSSALVRASARAGAVRSSSGFVDLTKGVSNGSA